MDIAAAFQALPRTRQRELLENVCDNMIENQAWESIAKLLTEQLGWDAVEFTNATCEVCGGQGYVESAVWATARYYSAKPTATRVVCWSCRP